MNRLCRLNCLLLLVLFAWVLWTPQAHANTYFTAYYGTTNTIDYNTAPANWVGGTVAHRFDKQNYSLGTSANLVQQSTSGGDKTFRVNPSDGYRIVSISWCEASWWPDAGPNHITPGTWHDVPGLATNQKDKFDFSIDTTNGKGYLIWVVFGPELSNGGKVGAWYGTNNTIGYDSPQANGSGGEVWQTTGTYIKLPNRVANGYSRSSNDTRTFEVRPAPGFRIVSIQYAVSLAPSSWNSVTVPANQTSNFSFSMEIRDGYQYVIWVQFSSTAASSFTVTGSVDPASDPSCTSSSVTPASRVINNSQTGNFTLSTSSNCSIDCVDFNHAGCVAWSGTGTTYTTPAITADSSFTVKFKPVGFTIDAYVDGSSPVGSGSISPAGTMSLGTAIQVAQGGSQTFTINANPGYSISHVYVTDPSKSHLNYDMAPVAGNPYTYTFSNVQANGIIRVKFAPIVPTSANDYCQIPPFVQASNNRLPNVLIVFDNSGSMGGTDNDGYAYFNTHTYGCNSSHNATNNLCNTIFYGYFDPYQMYKADPNNGNIYLKDSVTLNLSADNGMSGNYLNYRQMHKVDIIRKVLVGGRVTTAGSSTLASASRSDNTTDKFLYTDTKKWVQYGLSEPKGIIQDYAEPGNERVRFGVEVFGSTSNSNSDGGTIIAKLGSSLADLVAAIEGPETDPKTNTPIAEALYEAIRYFQAKPSAYNNRTDYGDSSTWGTPIEYPCQKNFVLLLTDGEANSTDKLPGLSTNPSLNSYTDSVFNVNTWVNRMAAADKPTSSDGKYSDGVAYWGHVADLRSTDFGNNMDGNQSITFYTVYAFGNGTGTTTLKSLSKYGGFNSTNGNDAGTAPNKYPSPDLTSEWDSLNGTADGIPDTYFEGSDGDVIGQKILDAIKSMTAKVSSGTAASILANSEGSGANLLQAVFYPVKDFDSHTSVKWIGELHNLWYFIDPFISNSTVREDSMADNALNLIQDRVVNYRFDGEKTVVNLSTDTDGDGLGNTSSGAAVDPDDVASIWRAGRFLWQRAASDRVIHTPCSLKDGSSACLACLGGTCPSGSANSGMMAFSVDNSSILGSYLQSADDETSRTIIEYVRGVDKDNYRTRYVEKTINRTLLTGTWKLGDIISSTPRLLSNLKLNTYNLMKPSGYGDLSYGNDLDKKGFLYTNTYKNRGMVFAGANDGMLHAFKLGKLNVTTTGFQRASLEDSTDIGKEKWAFIPKNALPYLKYMGDRNYGDNLHLNYVDGTTVLTDASIGITAADEANGVSACTETTAYWNCTKDLVNGSNWRTVVIGSMGTGGASRIKSDTPCTNCVKTPIFDPAFTDNSKGFGYSSYFALDVTNPENPTLLWEFSHPDLGFATTGAAIVRMQAPGDSTNSKNGRWLAVIGSGPTGPISDKQFHGRSDQPLKVFILDLKTGDLLGTVSTLADGTTLNNAFSGAIFNSVIDTDRGTPASAGFYQDDAVYMGYTQANTDPVDNTTTWTTGGVLRLVTGEKLNADGSLDLTSGWKLSKVIDNIGPVSTNIAKIVDRKNHNLWLYFGTGRYYDSGDDPSTIQRIFGIKEPCYKATVTHADSSVTHDDLDDNSCTDKLNRTTDLDDQTDNPSATLGALTNDGWYINLDAKTTTLDAERVLTDVVTTVNGAVYFTAFKPTSDRCSFGGETNMWALKYDSGAAPPKVMLKGKALLQLSTGSFEEVDLDKAFGAKEGRRTTVPLVGKPPTDAPPIISSSQNRPVKKVLHVREK